MHYLAPWIIYVPLCGHFGLLLYLAFSFTHDEGPYHACHTPEGKGKEKYDLQ
ncbi:hypothetical protein ACPOL_6591 [Acidisarcina polymorpha]|uniref:Uncharacterized protein n=1 Tax=Acidisarcina polymorpha TaxID=2211140 RepID=A0A2Z5G974_9BACT|nr:hypothetical protein ACPOL_6591 [Acidisarcina polymorpha]